MKLFSHHHSSMARGLTVVGGALLLIALAGGGYAGAQPPPTVSRPAAVDWAAPHVAGQLLVELPEAGAASYTAALARAGARIRRALPQLGLALIELPSGADLAAAAASLEVDAGVAWSEPNYTFTLDAGDALPVVGSGATFTPNDPYYLPRQDAYLSRVQMPGAWAYTTGQPEVVVAILDTGLKMDHEDLLGGVWRNLDEIPGNAVDDDGNGFVDDVNGWNFPDDSNRIYDDHGHGTHVAGTVAARTNNGLGIAGMAGGVTLMPVDVFSGGIGTYEDLIRAIIYATDNGARVINMSLGASSYSRGEEMAVDYAWSHGVVVVAAAGNSGQESYHYPAAHPHAIAVAATSASDTLCGFSTRGDFVDVAAPGCSVWSTVPGGYGWMAGTSMATPHVAGLAALILSLDPTLTAAEVRALIEKNVDDLGAPGWDKSFGHGRINAASALAMVKPAIGPTPQPPPSLPEWPAGCVDLIAGGDFEGDLGNWQSRGQVEVDATRAFSGTHALHFAGGLGVSGAVSKTLALPANPTGGTLWFAYRIENSDRGVGSTPEFPYDDWLTVEFRTQAGAKLVSLLRTGNTADTANSGLPWDRYVYRMQVADFEPLRWAGPVALVFTAQNDADSLPTDFWVDAVRFCVSASQHRYFLPTWLHNP